MAFFKQIPGCLVNQAFGYFLVNAGAMLKIQIYPRMQGQGFQAAMQLKIPSDLLKAKIHFIGTFQSKAIEIQKAFRFWR
jgi:hypothetical protein